MRRGPLPIRCVGAWLTLWVCLFSAPASAALLTGPEWRWDQRSFLERTLADFVSIPTGVADWSHRDFEVFSLWSAGVLALMSGEGPPDVALQDWSHATFGRPGTRFTFWGAPTDVGLWTAIGAVGIGLLVHGSTKDAPREVELVSLAVEAFCVAQVFQLVPKLLLGREGPMNGQGRALIFGPSMGWRLFPAGTPSGHAATIYAVMGTVSTYVDSPWLTAALQAFGLVTSFFLVIDDYHFLSDVLWGASMGWSIGDWVVRHRSTLYRDVAGEPVRLVPVIDPRGGAALSMSFRF